MSVFRRIDGADAPGVRRTMGLVRSSTQNPLNVTTVLDKQLKRQITVDGRDYTVAVDPDGMRLTGKGRRIPEVALRWRELLSGEAALSVALNASLDKRLAAPQPAVEALPARTAKRASKKPARQRR